MLQLAAAALVVDRARCRDAVRALLDQFQQLGVAILLLGLEHLHPGLLARQGALNEQGVAVGTADPFPVMVHSYNIDHDLVVLGHRQVEEGGRRHRRLAAAARVASLAVLLHDVLFTSFRSTCLLLLYIPHRIIIHYKSGCSPLLFLHLNNKKLPQGSLSHKLSSIIIRELPMLFNPRTCKSNHLLTTAWSLNGDSQPVPSLPMAHCLNRLPIPDILAITLTQTKQPWVIYALGAISSLGLLLS